MIAYTIHEPAEPPADLAARADATEFIKEGIAWWALFVPVLWLLYHRMWLELVGFIVVLLLVDLVLALAGFGNAAAGWSTLVLSLILALQANDLRRWRLARRGFRTVGAVTGKDRIECELKYFAAWPEIPELQEERPAGGGPARQGGGFRLRENRQGDDEVIGLFPDPGR